MGLKDFVSKLSMKKLGFVFVELKVLLTIDG